MSKIPLIGFHLRGTALRHNGRFENIKHDVQFVLDCSALPLRRALPADTKNAVRIESRGRLSNTLLFVVALIHALTITQSCLTMTKPPFI